MTLKQYISLMSLATLLCAGAVVFVLFAVDPEGSGVSGILLMYVSLFLALFGLFSLIIFAVESVFSRRETVAFRMVRKSFRQGVLLAALLLILLALAHEQLLYWWTVVPLVLVMVCVEFLWARVHRTYS